MNNQIDVFAFLDENQGDRSDDVDTLSKNDQEDYDEGDNGVQITYTGATLMAQEPDALAQSVHHPNEDQLYVFEENSVTVDGYTWPRLHPETEHTFKFKNPSAGLAIELTPTYIKYTDGTIIMPTQNTCYSFEVSDQEHQEQNKAEFRSFVDSWGAAMTCTEPETAVLRILLGAQETQAMIDRRSDMYRD